MKGIGGNVTAVIQTGSTERNKIGETVKTWTDAISVKGWLDFLSGQAGYSNFSAKVQESTHVFVGDYVPLPDVTAENSRMVVGAAVYDITLVDNPMGLGKGSQLEIYLKYTSGR